MSTTPQIRVLVVDDSVVVRRLVSEVLDAQAGIAVIATAGNGKIALQKLDQMTVDIVTLDVEMPELDGLATLAAIRKKFPRLPVIMFSTLTQRAAAATIEALTLGANDYVTKPDGTGSLSTARDRIRDQLVPKLRALCVGVAPVLAAPPSPVRDTKRPVTAIAIGVSTGGPPALEKVLSALPADLGVPVFIVQHMPPMFTALLATRLAGRCALPVAEVKQTTRVEPGRVYLAPGDKHMHVGQASGIASIALDSGPPENSCRPAVDVLFRSVAATYGDGTLAIVLTGMGSDGTRGSELVRARGGYVIAQDQATSVVWGMPGSVVRAGFAHQVVPLDDVVPTTLRRMTFRTGTRSMSRLGA